MVCNFYYAHIFLHCFITDRKEQDANISDDDDWHVAALSSVIVATMSIPAGADRLQ
jgi:hypothetical protein